MRRFGLCFLLALSVGGCALASVDDSNQQLTWGGKQYAERVCAERGFQTGMPEYDACYRDKARRRTALWACNNPLSGIWFKEDVCGIAE